MTANYIITEKTSRGIKPIYFILSFILIYILFFEYIFPLNSVFPQPSILFESIISLHKHYNLVSSFLYTISVIYFSVLIGYLFLFISAPLLVKTNKAGKSFENSLAVFRYFPLTGLAAIIILFFPNSIFAELIFTCIITYCYYLFQLKDDINNLKTEYMDSLIPLGVKPEKLFRDVVWKCAEPGLIRSTRELNYVVWTLVLFFEYIKGVHGIGYIFRMSLEYRDTSGLYILTFLSGLAIFLGTILIKLIQKKLIRWEP